MTEEKKDMLRGSRLRSVRGFGDQASFAEKLVETEKILEEQKEKWDSKMNYLVV